MPTQTPLSNTSATVANKSAATGRGDLLRALAAGVEHAPELLGFFETANPSVEIEIQHPRSNQIDSRQEGIFPQRQPLKMPCAYWVGPVVQSEVQRLESAQTLLWESMQADMWLSYFAFRDALLWDAEPLWSSSAIRQFFDAPSSARPSLRVDWVRTTEHLAQGFNLDQLPMQKSRRDFAEVHLLIDGAPEFLSMEEDARILVRHLLRLHGRRLHVWRLPNGPMGSWSAVGAPGAKAPAHLHGSQLLVFSDLGVITGGGTNWKNAMREWSNSGADLQVLFPGWRQELPQWLQHSALCVAANVDHGAETVAQPLTRLMEALSVAMVLDASVVRKLRCKLLPSCSPLLELELSQNPAFWQPETAFIQWRHGASYAYQDQLHACPFWSLSRKQTIANALLARHSHLSPACADEELLSLVALPGMNDWVNGADVQAATQRVEQMLSTLRDGLEPAKGVTVSSSWRAYVLNRYARTSPGVRQQFTSLNSKLNVVHDQVVFASSLPLPADKDGAVAFLDQEGSMPIETFFSLYQQGTHFVLFKEVSSWSDYFGIHQTKDELNASLVFENSLKERLLGFKVTGNYIGFTIGRQRKIWRIDDVKRPLVVDAKNGLFARADRTSEGLRIFWRDGHFDVHPLKRAMGVQAWRQVKDQVFADILSISGGQINDLLLSKEGYGVGGHLIGPSKDGPAGAQQLWINQGIDRYGVFAEFAITDSVAQQRLRYIPPGTFLMGSPDGIGHDDEHPQHLVTIAQGYWLADTPCTQALWQAVMGSNPSLFSEGPDAPRRPVERVSHVEVGQFLKKLQGLMPAGVEVVLPNEAQWEYACRAGTTTAYWWGDIIDKALANIDEMGNRNWEGNEGTSPVAHYPANPWGLYDMHGNVWEWCADERRVYSAGSEFDPKGAIGGGSFAVRGGSWFELSGSARAALRSSWQYDSTNRSQGFRFCLRTSSSSSENDF